jgi:hypothetical protein
MARPANADALRIQRALQHGLLLPCTPPTLDLPGLDSGECAAISRALEIDAAVLLDERAARAGCCLGPGRHRHAGCAGAGRPQGARRPVGADDRKAAAKLEAKLLEGLHGIESGLTPADWTAIRKEAAAKFEA